MQQAGARSEKTALEKFLSSRRGGYVTLSFSRRGNKLAVVKLVEKNIESALDEDSALVDLQTALNR